MNQSAPSTSTSRRGVSHVETKSRRGQSTRHSKRERKIAKVKATPPPYYAPSSLLQEGRRVLSTLCRSVLRLLVHIQFLSVVFTVLQNIFFRGLALLHYVNDFPVRVQFRRTTRRFLSVMNTTESYATFVDAAASLDHYCGVAQWADEAPPLDRCDAAGLLVDAVAAQELVSQQHVDGMEVFLCSLLKRNAHGLMDPSIYNYFNCAKHCIEDYTRSVEDLIVAYAESALDRTPSMDGTAAEGGGVAGEGAVKGKMVARDGPARPPHPCWVRMDALQRSDTAASPHLPFSYSWETTSAKRHGAAATTVAGSGIAAQLPAVEIAGVVQRAWRRTAVAAATSMGSSRGVTVDALSRPPRVGVSCRSPLQRSSAAASTVAPSSVSRGGGGASTRSPVVRSKAFSRLLLGSASAGEESNYLTEDETATPSATSAVGSPATVLHAGFPKPVDEARRFLPDLLAAPTPRLAKPATRSTAEGSDDAATVASTRDTTSPPSTRAGDGAAKPLAEQALLAHIDASCTALHRFLNGGTTAAAAAASSPLSSSSSCEQRPVQRRLRVLRQVLHSFGRTALVLSGGSSMGTYHAGVARALYEADVLPDILSGSSAGSIIAALICTKSPAELHSFMRSDVLSTEAMQMSPFGEDATLAEKLRRFFRTGFLMDVRTLMECMRGQCGDLTFLEAYELTGKVLNVSVTRSQQEGTPADRHALLNYVTAPDVLIWSAVSASCALPGLFTAVQLIKKTPLAGGAFEPYLPGELWCDGSVAQDIPRRLLTQLFGVDYLVVSQVNPYVIPFLRHPPSALVVASSPSFVSRLWFALVAVLGWVLTVLFSLRLLSRSGACEMLFLAFAQDYGGDLTIYPVESLLTAAPDYLNLVNNPSAEYISYVSSRAQCRTWPLVTRIRCATTIERCLVREIRRLEAAQFVGGKAVARAPL